MFAADPVLQLHRRARGSPSLIQRGGAGRTSPSINPPTNRRRHRPTPMDEPEREQGTCRDGRDGAAPQQPQPQEQQEAEDLVRLLPDDALAAALRRLAPRDLAAARCVRRAWCALVDERRLLRPRLLPRAVAGVFVNFNNFASWEFFARPTAGPAVSGELAFVPAQRDGACYVQDHCNGLLLCYHCVVNPATRRWAPVPPRPTSRNDCKNSYFYHNEYLVFDPAMSPHYELFSIPRIIHKSRPGDVLYRHIDDELDPSIEGSEWPPSPWILHVFSSKTGEWEERAFLREGEKMGNVSDMRKALWMGQKRYAAYWHGALYVHCESEFVTKISLSENKYQIIKPPVGIKVDMFRELYLGKSENGVYCAFVDHLDQDCHLWVWILKELCDQLEWVMFHRTNLGSILACRKLDQQIDGLWILRDINSRRRRHSDEDDNEEAKVQEKFEWDSENDDVLQVEGNNEDYDEYIDFLGFHPYKEVVYLSESLRRGLAYHLKNSNVQYLGNLYPTNYGQIAGQHQLIRESFPCTPCWMGDCPP
ncbi:hypothetical protein ACP4OV_007723 [Aristida adscensionis]